MEDFITRGKKHVMNTYNRLPVMMVRGEGSRIWDSEGREYLDFLAGIAVNSLGHCHPAVVEAIREQAGQLIHCSNLYWIEPQIRLAEKLAANSCCDKVFFCNSGAEANEGAIKCARKWGRGRYKIISMERSFHGRTLATVTATGQAKYHQGFNPLPEGFSYVPYNDSAALEEAVDDLTCAIIMEPVQGEGGVRPAEPEFMKFVGELCKRKNLLLIMDEVQAGMGRTGKPFGYMNYEVEPDIITMAKALGGGTAIGAMMAKEEAAVFVPGDHASTFGGNPLAAAAGLAAAEILFSGDLLKEVLEKGEYFKVLLEEMSRDIPVIKEVRGLGLMIGCELSVDAGPVVARAMEKGVLINGIGGNILRFVPPLTVTREEINHAVSVLKEVLREEK